MTGLLYALPLDVARYDVSILECTCIIAITHNLTHSNKSLTVYYDNMGLHQFNSALIELVRYCINHRLK